jgi:predicted transcriptional regulator/transcriptional regulator with XRE-family HTH domain
MAEARPRLGAKIRALRRRENITQARLADQLEISASYLNLIEHDRRPLSAPLLIRLAGLFDLDLQSFAEQTDALLQTELAEVFSDPLFEAENFSTAEAQDLAQAHPAMARAVVRLYRRYRAARDSAQEQTLDDAEELELAGVDRSRLPAEEVSDFIQRHRNHFPTLETAAEVLWTEAKLHCDEMYHGLRDHLHRRLGVRVCVVSRPKAEGALRRYDPDTRSLLLSEDLPRGSRKFQMAHQIGLLGLSDLLDELTDDEALTTDQSRRLGRVALASYFAAALLMPYRLIHEAAERSRYDVDLIGNQFGTSFEQVCHRLTTLGRKNEEAVPFHFVRTDIAGNVSKRFSASGIPIARFGGACPRWNLHSAFLTPGRISVQVSEMPDGQRYLCLARTVVRGGQGYHTPRAVYAISLGCDVVHAPRLIYADGLDLDDPSLIVPIGTTCRLCDRTACEQRAFPSLRHPLTINEDARGVSFYAPVSE